MTPGELRAIIDYLRHGVGLEPQETDTAPVITFKSPTLDEMLKEGLNAEGAKRVLGAPWWDEMVEDIIETPDMCEPDDTPDQVLEYARDVVQEYIFKRFPLEKT